ncbi:MULTISPECIES: YbaY family lipoprotein [unclassified Ruegeria]|uniref:YbaY family lipoprotein n=1 Tax=unclassified Ruegeria TaxID=2625375 RepID=UPI0014896B1B|nr:MULTISPECIES: YbaY family lipoprotein [unclassified Ruegeria]
MKRPLAQATSTAVFAALAGSAFAGTIEGSASYRERIATPPDATLYVELQDISRADAPSVTLSAKRYALTGVPVQYELSFDDALIKENHSYAVRGSIFVGDQLLFTTDTVYPVLTNDNGTVADLMLVQVQGQEVASLDNTKWSLIGIDGVALETDRHPELMFDTDGQFGGTGGCNRFTGQAEISGQNITFPDNLAATLMACLPELEEVERQFFVTLQKVATYAQAGDSLVMLDRSGAPVLNFVRIP